MQSWLIKQALSYLLDRLQEASTWAAIAAALAADANIQFNSDFQHALIAAGVNLAALAGVLIKEGARK